MQVVLDYPCKTSNIANSAEDWQMDVGPLLMPQPEPTDGPDVLTEGLLIDKLSLGYLVYNKLDCAPPLY
jgi:hypothetical protein